MEFCCERTAPIVKTTAGDVRGYHWQGVDIFKGIPYGTARRWHAATAPKPWSAPLDATSYGCVCPLLSMDKPASELKVPHRYWVQDEDCLNLNVWTPGCDTAGRPVVVWLHGGGFAAGSAIEQLAYEGGAMALQGDCVVVSVNHRLNILGYFDLSEYGEEYAHAANAGTEDTILALAWVRDNIAAFGGDPARVTVMGQSGGGAKINALLQTPAADGLFRAGIIMSGIVEFALSDCHGSMKPCVEALMEKLGCTQIFELEQVPFAQLAAAYNAVQPGLAAAGHNTGGAPTRGPGGYAGDPLAPDGAFRRESVDVPLMVGSVFGEVQGFRPGRDPRAPEKVLGQAAADQLAPLFAQAYPHRPAGDLLMTDTLFRPGAIHYIQKRAAAGGKVYSYLFDQDFPLDGGTPPWHCADIPFVFHNIDLVPSCQFAGAGALQARMFACVMSFVRGGGPGWHASSADTERTMIFGPVCKVVENHDHALMQALVPHTGALMKAMQDTGAAMQH